MRRRRIRTTPAAHSEFAIRVTSVSELFWPFDARPVAERDVTADVRWALLDEWERVRHRRPSSLLIYAPKEEREITDESAAATALRSTLESASGPLRRVEPLSRQEKVSARIGIAFWFLSIVVSTGIDRVSEDVLAEGIAQGIILVGWVALWPPAARVVVDVVPHLFNRRRFAEFADIDVRFVWT